MSLILPKIHLLEVILQLLALSGRHPADLQANLTKGQDFPYFTYAGSWSVFIGWFYHLLHHQYFWEAQRILHSLFHVVPWFQCVVLVQACIEAAVTMRIGKESVKIAVSSLVQRLLYVVESGDSNPLAVVQWNDAITRALFGMTLVEAGGKSASLLSCFCLRRSLPEKLDLQISFPLDGAGGKDGIPDSLYERILRLRAHAQTMRQPMTAESLGYAEFLGNTDDELNSWALFQAVQDRPESVLLFLNSRTLNARDSYQRTPLHWASLNGEKAVVELLVSEWNADVGIVDWFGCTPLHYAVKFCLAGREEDFTRIMEALLRCDPTQVDIRYPGGVTPLRMAIRRRSYNAAALLRRYNARVEESDYKALAQDDESHDYRAWLSLMPDHPQYHPRSLAITSSTADLSFSPMSQKAMQHPSHAIERIEPFALSRMAQRHSWGASTHETRAGPQKVHPDPPPETL